MTYCLSSCVLSGSTQPYGRRRMKVSTSLVVSVSIRHFTKSCQPRWESFSMLLFIWLLVGGQAQVAEDTISHLKKQTNRKQQKEGARNRRSWNTLLYSDWNVVGMRANWLFLEMYGDVQPEAKCVKPKQPGRVQWRGEQIPRRIAKISRVSHAVSGTASWNQKMQEESNAAFPTVMFARGKNLKKSHGRFCLRDNLTGLEQLYVWAELLTQPTWHVCNELLYLDS